MKIIFIKWNGIYGQELYKLVIYKNKDRDCKVLRYTMETNERRYDESSYSVKKDISIWKEYPIELLVNELLEALKDGQK